MIYKNWKWLSVDPKWHPICTKSAINITKLSVQANTRPSVGPLYSEAMLLWSLLTLHTWIQKVLKSGELFTWQIRWRCVRTLSVEENQ